jgi:opacity protein-like surface antigen
MKIKLLPFMLLLPAISFAQKKFSTYIGLGMGGVIENRNTIPDCTSKGSLRVGGYISQYYHFNERISIGLQLSGGGEITSTVKCSKYDAASNTVFISGNSLTASSYLLRGRYIVNTKSKIKPYVDLGIGTTTYFYNSIAQDQDRLSKSSFAMSTELGVEVLNKLSISCIGIFGGKTPSYKGYDFFSRQNKVLQSITSHQIYLTVGYRLFNF